MATARTSDTPDRRLEQARAVLQNCQSPGRKTAPARLPTGLPGLDNALGGGVPRPGVCEIIPAAEGTGAFSLALRLAAIPTEHHAPLAVIDPPRLFYPPAAAQLGLPLDRLLIIRPPDPPSALWATEQILASGAVAAVLAHLPAIPWRASRRIQLACETGHATAWLVRPVHSPAPARFVTVRITVEPLPRPPASSTAALRPRLLRLWVLHVPTGRLVGPLLTEMDHEARDVRVHALPAHRPPSLRRQVGG